MIPSGLLTGFVDGREVRITELSPESFFFRTAAPVEQPEKMKICFYDFSGAFYREIEIMDSHFRQEKAEPFYWVYQVEVFQENYRQAVQKLFLEYARYIRTRLEESDGELSRRFCGYPAQLDEIHSESMEEQKKKWFGHVRLQRVDTYLEFALELDRWKWYEIYRDYPLAEFMEQYWKENGIRGWEKNRRLPDRLYIGNQFCHFLLPDEKLLFGMMDKAYREELAVTLAFPCLRDFQTKKWEKLLQKVENWAKIREVKVEILVNDWGMAQLVKEAGNCLKPCLGILLNKQKKDPRIRYKKGSIRGLGENNLQAEFYRNYLYRSFGIERYEWESCGYPQSFPEGKNSLHLPYYQTNTSQYCPLYASCLEGDRGRQKLPETCPRYCESYAYLYPEHLHMAGRYNSLFGLDSELVEHPEQLEACREAGIDRLVIGL